MTTQPPLLPETAFKPLSPTRLEAMIDNALTHQQLPGTPHSNIIAFRRPWVQQLAFGTGMATLAASILLAFMLTPQNSMGNLTATAGSAPQAISADVSDLLLLETLS